MELITWPAGVNKIILDSTTVSVGEGASEIDTVEASGQKRMRLSCANPPDKYQVKMAFDFSEKNSGGRNDGLTELERFWTWYKWKHCYGVNPFQFPAILLNSNRQKGYGEEEQRYGNKSDNEYYRITSAVSGSKSGLSLELTMTWETFSTGYISIEEDSAAVDSIEAENGCVALHLTNLLSTYPSVNDYSLLINGNKENILQADYDSEETVYIYFLKKTVAGNYTASVNGKSSVFKVE